MVTDLLEKPEIKHSGKYIIWCEEEKEILRINYRGTSQDYRLIQEIIKNKFDIIRSKHSIRSMASQLGLTSKKADLVWTDERISQLRKLATNYSAKQIANKLHCSLGAVYNKCFRLNIKLDSKHRNDWYNLQDVCAIFGICEQKVQRLIHDGKIKHTFYTARIYKFTAKNLKDFFCQYPVELQGRNVDLVQIRDILCPNYQIKYND